jgi:hypothetical protein
MFGIREPVWQQLEPPNTNGWARTRYGDDLYAYNVRTGEMRLLEKGRFKSRFDKFIPDWMKQNPRNIRGEKLR